MSELTITFTQLTPCINEAKHTEIMILNCNEYRASFQGTNAEYGVPTMIIIVSFQLSCIVICRTGVFREGVVLFPDPEFSLGVWERDYRKAEHMEISVQS